MSTFLERLDRFVRWFFNSSPTVDLIQPAPPLRHQPKAAATFAMAPPAAREPANPPQARMNRINA